MSEEKKFLGTTIIPLFQDKGVDSHSVFLNGEFYEAFQAGIKDIAPGGVIKVKFATKGKPSAYLEYLSAEELETLKERREAKAAKAEESAPAESNDSL